jgi:protein TonB
MSGSAYGSLVNAELNRRKRYPPMARDMGIEGSVGVSFTVGASGRVVSHAITRPSGHASLDESVRSLMASVAFPPPPGGVFPYSTSIRFRLE